MRFLERSDTATVIAINETETTFLKATLSKYPLVTNENRELTRSDDHDELEEDTELLRSSIKEHTDQSKTKLSEWLASDKIFTPKDSEWLLNVPNEDLDWFLQILNDLRVGSWQQLKCPSPEEIQALPLTPETVEPLWTMELAGLLQSFLLRNH